MSDDAAPNRLPRRMVRFHDGVIQRGVQLFDRKAIPEPGAKLLLQSALRKTFDALLAETEHFRYTRVFSSLTPDELQQLDARATKGRPGYVAPDFDSYYFVDGPEDGLADAKILREGRFADVVRSVGSLSPVSPANGDWDLYTHFHAGPVGTHAERAWDRGQCGRGAGVGFADIEEAQPFPHECVPRDRYELIGQDWGVSAAHRAHTTAVLGIVLANQTGPDAFGAASSVERAFVASYLDGNQANVANAIAKAAAELESGDVLLIEAQVGVYGYHPVDRNNRRMNVPVEFDWPVRDAILKATNAGVVVIEAGGNGADGQFPQDIDALERKDGTKFSSVPGNPEGDGDKPCDSGAIIVSAAELTDDQESHRRLLEAPYGARIDCYARGIGVRTCGNTGNGDDGCSPQWFSGTSAASAIIAATALQLQGIVKNQRNGVPLTPRVLRHVFRNEDWGNGPTGDSGAIGVMPDLGKIIEHLPEIMALSDADCET